MAEVHRLDVEMSEKAKTNLVSSISHELRSPLHGILGTSEILRDTAMNALQHGLVHTIESCGRTLLDTINHLLDFSKINNFRKEGGNKALHKRKSPLRGHKNTDPSPHSLKPSRRSRHTGMISLRSDIQLDAVLEEVTESVFAGYSFYHSPQRSMTIDRPNHMALDVLGPFQQASQVSIILDIDEGSEWRFSTQIGAWRRIMMNIFGNALKYTKTGFILVKLTASPAKDAVPGGPCDFKVTLTVKDTGIGMSMEYLQSSLFTPFTQEDSLAPGNGLGLSIVHHAVLSMGGHIEVTSLRGRGTEVSIEVPLAHVPAQKANASLSEPEPILKMKHVTRGATLGLLELGSPDISDRDTILCTSLEKLCKNWFEMDVHILNPLDASFPSCDFYVAVQTDTDSVNTWESWLSRTQNSSHNNVENRRSPIVVICRSPEAAHLMFVAANQSNHETIVEFISQPCGPRKLAKAFNICIKRQQGHDRLAESDPNIDQDPPRERVTFQLTEPFPVSKKNIETQRAEDETDFEKHRAGKKAIDDEYRKLDETEDSQEPDATHLSQNEIDAIDLPIRQELPKIEEPALTVLLVEDNDINLQILVAHMKKEGYRYTTARNGLEALDTFKAHPTKFGVILMDISMPVMNGFESTRLIRKAEREYQSRLDISAKESFTPVTIVALTGLASASDRHEAYGSGMDLFLAKPIQRKELFTVLNERNPGEVKKASQ
ncbi:CheY-like superfamily [Penicillium fimorum]|uniref:CheY-like superfamily n=1 Tax=Penicillium fimorum TaxID=1882269 RepID=A0A9W9XZB3_9EURO|nr:CheY-like superfamily [Penicillium fimorum]